MSEFPGPTWIFLSSSVCSTELIHSKVHGKEEKGRETENQSEKANKNKRVSITCLVIKGIRRKFVLSVIHGKGRQALHPVIQDCVSVIVFPGREGREGGVRRNSRSVRKPADRGVPGNELKVNLPINVCFNTQMVSFIFITI